MKRYAIVLVLAAAAFASCSLTRGGVTLAFQSSETSATTAVLPRALLDTGVEVTEFQLSIREVEFKQNDDDPDSPADVYFAGPYTVDLLDAAGPLAQTIGDAEVPRGIYQELRFKLHKTTDVETTSVLYDRSIYLAGTINGTPFEMWHDTSENLDVGKATGIEVASQPITLTIDFSLPDFLDQQDAGGVLIDLTTAVDGDGDGTIEINPNSDDGTVNEDLADTLKDNIKLVADILES